MAAVAADETDPLSGQNSHMLMTVDAYISDRLQQYQAWYDKKSTRMKANYLRMRVIAVAGGLVVPALVNLAYGGAWKDAAVSVISLLVAASVSLEGVFRYRDQWKNYRSTEQLLGHELIYFQTRNGPYDGLDDGSAYRQLVVRVEAAIAAENSATLNVMTTAPPSIEGT
jgi:hypothetical protein